jgi:hypothetical protein
MVQNYRSVTDVVLRVDCPPNAVPHVNIIVTIWSGQMRIPLRLMLPLMVQEHQQVPHHHVVYSHLHLQHRSMVFLVHNYVLIGQLMWYVLIPSTTTPAPHPHFHFLATPSFFPFNLSVYGLSVRLIDRNRRHSIMSCKPSTNRSMVRFSLSMYDGTTISYIINNM